MVQIQLGIREEMLRLIYMVFKIKYYNIYINIYIETNVMTKGNAFVIVYCE